MTGTIRASVLVLLGCLLSAPVIGETVGWRNDGTGHFPTATPPSEWSSDKNVVWKAALPGTSYAAPIVVGDRVFVLSDPGELLCVARADGKVLWRKSTKGGGGGGGGGKFGKGGGKGGKGGMGGMGGMTAGNTAATPVSDGKHVAAVFGTGIVGVYTLEGKELWNRLVERPTVFKGQSASPLILDGKLIIQLNDLVALDVLTGKEAWRVTTPASHASPVATKLGKDAVVISCGGAVVRARDGKVLGRGTFRASDSSPIVSGDTLFVPGRGAYKLAVKGADEVTVTSLWAEAGGGGGGRMDKRYASPVAYEGLLYDVHTTSGVLSVVDLKTGESVYKKRLPVGQVYSSITMAGGYLYVLDTAGKAVVFKPGREYENISVNSLEGTGSGPAFAGEQLFIRGRTNLYCVSAKPKAKGSD